MCPRPLRRRKSDPADPARRGVRPGRRGARDRTRRRSFDPLPRDRPRRRDHRRGRAGRHAGPPECETRGEWPALRPGPRSRRMHHRRHVGDERQRPARGPARHDARPRRGVARRPRQRRRRGRVAFLALADGRRAARPSRGPRPLDRDAPRPERRPAPRLGPPGGARPRGLRATRRPRRARTRPAPAARRQ